MSVLDIFRPPRPLHVERVAEVQRFNFTEGQFDFEPWLFSYVGGGGYQRTEDVESSFIGYVQAAYKASGVVFACMAARSMIFSEARFRWQSLRKEGRPGNLFGTQELAVLERPWPNGTTGELLARMIQDVDLAGNFYAVREDDRLRRLRPDWVTIILSAPPAVAIKSDVIGYRYSPGGGRTGADVEPVDEIFTTDEIVHWSPIPDPDAQYRGMSWLTPVIREVQSDKAATLHKLKFFENGATPQIVVALPAEMTSEQFRTFIEANNAASQGVNNAYKTMYVGGGGDPKVVGSDLRQLDFKATQGAGETRIAAAARIHPVIVGLSEGMQGSSLNAGNFSAARRIVADGTMRPLWRSACAALETVLERPPGSPVRLWYDDRDIAFLREDAKDAADIEQIKASTITVLVREGFTPESSIAAVNAQDMTLLVHTGLVSVQLQPPGTTAEPPGKAGASSDADDDGEPDEQTQALLDAFDAVTAGRTVGEWYVQRDADFESKHPRGPDGKFLSLIERLIGALKKHLDGDGDGDPFEGFDRKQLRAAAKKRGLDIPNGATRDEIAELLKADLKANLPGGKASKATKAAKKVAKKAAPPAVVPMTPEQIFDWSNTPAGTHIATAVDPDGDPVHVFSTGEPGVVKVTQLGESVEVDIGELDDEFGILNWEGGATPPPIKAAKKAVKKVAPVKKVAKHAAPAAASHNIDHVPETVHQQVFTSYKSLPTGQLMGSPAPDSYDNLVAVAHIYGKDVPGGLSVEQAAKMVDEQLAKAQHIDNKHFLEKKILDWLDTPAGRHYAETHTTPKPEIVQSITGRYDLPEGVTLKPGEKVHKLSGPGAVKGLEESDFYAISADKMQKLQDDVMAGKDWTPDQKKAIRNYTGGGYAGINGYLRGTWPTTNPLTKKQAVDLQSAMLPLKEHVRLRRGVGFEQLPAGFRNPAAAKGLKGKTLEWPEFFSTSVAGEHGHFTHQKVQLIIEAPAGTHGAFVKQFSIHPSENEFILSAGNRYKVIRVEDVDQYGNVIIRMRVVTKK